MGAPNNSCFERLGGEPVLRTIIDSFVDVMVEDAMIGFLFHSVDRERLKQMEYEFTAQFLGGPVSYRGRPIKETHAKHRIRGGQFDRRACILKETLERYEVPNDIQQDWMEHVERLRGTVTQDAPGECDVPDRTD